ncbi:hypothetical protein BUALT_Bualt17G0103700 [Buddleja alternifolia]|uniref:Response regulatory domain-containing protein n=1 Tax=Buddleja alternifolia TaxID=168488 RepID=A0AAV6WI71_9LAMI|nr:hypothetical protein BUALT_Bualt17G0103700 [Buddleja alternifolia]
MSREDLSAVPTPFRNLRVLLIDNDTSSLLDMASMLEDCSYKVTTTELAAVALSILEERKDHFDLVMADFDMPEMDCIKFINSVHLIKDFPVILMSLELNKDTIEEAMRNGACFFLKKPISSKKLKNVWQHVYRKSKNKSNIIDQDLESQGDKVKKEGEDIDPTTLHDDEQIADSDQIENNLVRGKSLTKSTEICNKRKRIEDESDLQKQIKQSSEVEEFEAFTDSSNFSAAFIKLIQETDKPNLSEVSPSLSKFSIGTTNVNQKLDFMTESASSGYSLKQKQLMNAMDVKKGED